MRELSGRPEIDYPCEWGFRLIGWDETDIRGAVAHVLGGQDHSLTYSNASSTGKYCSLNLEMRVLDETHRLGVFEALLGHPSIRLVL